MIEEWIDCYNCGGSGEIEGDCTCWDDTCCCLHPEPPICDVCRGRGGWQREIKDAVEDVG